MSLSHHTSPILSTPGILLYDQVHWSFLQPPFRRVRIISRSQDRVTLFSVPETSLCRVCGHDLSGPSSRPSNRHTGIRSLNCGDRSQRNRDFTLIIMNETTYHIPNLCCSSGTSCISVGTWIIVPDSKGSQKFPYRPFFNRKSEG